MGPLVSIIIPTLNRAELLRRAIESVLAQTYTPIEVVVVIDGIDDPTERLLTNYSNDHRIKVIQNNYSTGGAEARNIGVANAGGEWIAFLDDDDEWMPNKLELQMNEGLRSGSEYPIVYSRLIARSPEADYVWPVRERRESESMSEYLFCRNTLSQGEGMIQTSTILALKQLLVRIPFTKGLPKHQDWDWLLRVSSHIGVTFVMCPETLAIWYIEESRSSVSKKEDWRASLQWVLSMTPFMTGKARSSFLLIILGNSVIKQRSVTGILCVLYNAVRLGSPRFFDFILFFAMLLLPINIRRTMGRRKMRRVVSHEDRSSRDPNGRRRSSEGSASSS